MNETVENSEFEMFRETAKNDVMIVRSDIFSQLARMYLTEVPVAGAAAYRTKDGSKRGILINWDYYENHLNSGSNYTDLIDFEVDHEIYELWETKDEKEKIDPKGSAHYDAIKYAMKRAQIADKLDRYMELKRKQFEFFEKHGDTEARKELEFYEAFAKELVNT